MALFSVRGMPLSDKQRHYREQSEGDFAYSGKSLQAFDSFKLHDFTNRSFESAEHGGRPSIGTRAKDVRTGASSTRATSTSRSAACELTVSISCLDA